MLSGIFLLQQAAGYPSYPFHYSRLEDKYRNEGRLLSTVRAVFLLRIQSYYPVKVRIVFLI
jgi:hypothetical protein